MSAAGKQALYSPIHSLQSVRGIFSCCKSNGIQKDENCGSHQVWGAGAAFQAGEGPTPGQRDGAVLATEVVAVPIVVPAVGPAVVRPAPRP